MKIYIYISFIFWWNNSELVKLFQKDRLKLSFFLTRLTWINMVLSHFSSFLVEGKTNLWIFLTFFII